MTLSRTLSLRVPEGQEIKWRLEMESENMIERLIGNWWTFGICVVVILICTIYLEG